MMAIKRLLAVLGIAVVAASVTAAPNARKLQRWLKRFPEADANRDGTLTPDEAQAFRNRMRGRQGGNATQARRRQGAPREFAVDPGWDEERFPAHAVCYKTPAEIKAIYAKLKEGAKQPVTSFEEPESGTLRIVGTGHSFMAPGYRTFPQICRADGFEQPLFTHTGGGMTGSARYKWEEENGIFQFDGKPKPRLLASIANAEWDAMMWGPYFNDRPEYYACWIEFCLKYNPEMRFYLSDAWPQLGQLEQIPQTEDEFSAETFVRLGKERNQAYTELLGTLNGQFGKRVYILPTSDAMVLATQYYFRGELPGVVGINQSVGGKERSLWRDRLGHLGPGFDRLEGYVFYATIYGRSPALLEGDIPFREKNPQPDFPSTQLDRLFRRIAWQATIGNPLSGVTDTNENGIDDARE